MNKAKETAELLAYLEGTLRTVARRVAHQVEVETLKPAMDRIAAYRAEHLNERNP
jgi:hypothetical protein